MLPVALLIFAMFQKSFFVVSFKKLKAAHLCGKTIQYQHNSELVLSQQGLLPKEVSFDFKK